MRVNVCYDERSTLIDVSDDIEYENFKALCAAEFGFDSTDGFKIILNGNAIPESGEKPIRTLGISDNDLVMIRPASARRQSQSQPQAGQPAGAPQMSMEALRGMLASNPQQLEHLRRQAPELASAIERGDQAEVMQQLNRYMAATQGMGAHGIPQEDVAFDPLDPAYQEKMYEQIRRENIDANLEHALEHSPESFGHVVMLYINAKVNGEPVKAFVDSGAQMTIMSKACAERCHLMKLLDPRFAGIAKGVGVQKILGRVHLAQMQIGNDYLQCTISVLEDQDMDFLLGLDMLRRHQCSIDLKKNVLRIGTTEAETPFLSESELPKFARLNYEAPESERQKLQDKLAAQEGLKNGGASTSGTASASSSTTNGDRASSAGTKSAFPDAAFEEITKRGFSREEAARALSDYNGDSKKALANLLVSKLTSRSASAKGPRQ